MKYITDLEAEAQTIISDITMKFGWKDYYKINDAFGIPQKFIDETDSYKATQDEAIADKLKKIFETYDSSFQKNIIGFEKVEINISSKVIEPSKIEISDNPCNYINPHSDKGIFDLLGVYQKDGNNAEGKIILYKICIEEFSKDFYAKNTCFPSLRLASEAECVDMIYKIVFWHEMGHWITHWMLDADEFRWDDRFWTLIPNPNDLLEGLAQAITYYLIINDADSARLKFMFEYLLLGQSPPYHKHIDIIKHPNFSWKNFFKALELIRQEKNQNLATYLDLLGKL